ncbi:MAG: hypothetical protein SGJ09_09425, partial [Phycisphaerae bacterium]|nr:hypothetical protein [Phycisphaerae bacterium]
MTRREPSRIGSESIPIGGDGESTAILVGAAVEDTHATPTHALAMASIAQDARARLRAAATSAPSAKTMTRTEVENTAVLEAPAKRLADALPTTNAVAAGTIKGNCRPVL